MRNSMNWCTFFFSFLFFSFLFLYTQSCFFVTLIVIFLLFFFIKFSYWMFVYVVVSCTLQFCARYVSLSIYKYKLLFFVDFFFFASFQDRSLFHFTFTSILCWVVFLTGHFAFFQVLIIIFLNHFNIIFFACSRRPPLKTVSIAATPLISCVRLKLL